MASITIRNLEDAVKARIRVRAAEHGRSMEEEARDILRAAVRDHPKPTNLAELAAALFGSRGVDLEPHPPVPVRKPPDLEIVIVLDTNVVSEAMKPAPDARVIAWLRAQRIQELTTTAITLAEINYGFRRLPPGRRRDDLGARFRTFMAQGFADRVLAFDASAADSYAEIVSARQSAGRPIDAFDAMIAAIARSHGATIATRDTADFDGCGLPLQNPWS